MSQEEGSAGALWILLLGFALIGWWSGWWGHRIQWTGYVYPDMASESFFKIGPFDKFEQCQEASIGALRSMNRAVEGAYECGSNCTYDKRIGIDVCKETRK